MPVWICLIVIVLLVLWIVIDHATDKYEDLKREYDRNIAELKYEIDKLKTDNWNNTMKIESNYWIFCKNKDYVQSCIDIWSSEIKKLKNKNDLYKEL